MQKKIKWWLVGLTLVALSGVAFAAGPGFGPFGKANCPNGFNRLNLTPEQKTKMNELQEKHWKETISLRNEMQTRRLELKTLWSIPNPDKDKILSKQKELNDLRDKMQAKATDFRIESRKILTPEQAAQIGAFGSAMGFGSGCGNRGGGYGMRGQGPCGRGFGPDGVKGPGPGFRSGNVRL